MPQFLRRRRGVLVMQDEQPLGLAPHGLGSDEALAAIGYRLDGDGRAVPVAPRASARPATTRRPSTSRRKAPAKAAPKASTKTPAKRTAKGGTK
ncbi:MAG: hypothetical protein AB7G36_18810 [Candidatus Nanopelagicales bacterium]